MRQTPLWIFGYGSLMWNPGFAYDRQLNATLSGYSRSFCMRSIHHRGTSENPGLVLALDKSPDGACEGVAFRVQAGNERATITYLRERELISSAYLETQLPVKLASGENVAAVTFVVDVDHWQYCGYLPLLEQLEIIAGAVGGRGSNVDYLINTAEHLDTLGIKDPDLSWLCRKIRKSPG